MIRGILSGVTAMRAQLLNQEVIANNLANVNTAAYNKDKVVFSTFSDALMYAVRPAAFPQVLGAVSTGAVAQNIETIHTVGPLEETGEPLDVALPGGQYLVVETAGGQRYTRRGDLSIAANGYLTVAGYRVMGQGGPIQVDNHAPVRIAEDGTVYNGTTPVDVLSVVGFVNESSLVKEGYSLFRPSSGGPQPVGTIKLTVGALEKSSVDPVTEMVNLIYAMRSYEAAQKAIQSHDETLDQAVTKVGSV